MTAVTYSWSEPSSGACYGILCLRIAKALFRLCRCTGSSEHSLLSDAKLKPKVMILDFLQFKLKDIKLFQKKCYLLQDDVGSGSILFASS